jgi:tRNA G10  N-methylase Trm11
MGRRVQVESLRGLIRDLFQVSAEVLCPGGRLIFPNPLQLENPHPELRLQYRQTVDMGGFDCAIEKYVKLAPKGAPVVTPKVEPGIRPISRRPGV